MPRLFPLAILFVVGVGWGTGVILVKYATRQGIHPLGYVFWVAFGAFAIMLAVSALRRRLPRLGRQHLAYYGIVGGLRLAGANIIFYTVVQHIPAGVMAVVLGTMTIFTYAMALGLGIERFAALRMAGILTGLAGVVLFVVPRSSLPEPGMAWWVMAGLGAPLLYSVANMVIDRLRPAGDDSTALTAGMLAAASLFTGVVALAFDAFHVPGWPPTTAETVMICHMAISALGFLGLFELIRVAGPTYASQLTYIVTLSGVLIGIVVFGERHSAWVWSAVALVLLGVGLVNAQGRAPTRQSLDREASGR